MPRRKPSLRERKKQQTKAVITGVARRLFDERGFDKVSVAEIAREADVSEGTVFNYFPTKEALVFHRGAAGRDELIEAVRNRPAGVSVVEPFRAWTMRHLDRVERQPVEATVAAPRLVMESKTLRNRLFLVWEEEASILAGILAEQADDEDLLVPMIVGRTLAWAHRLVFRAAFTRLLAGESRRRVAADLRIQANRAYDALENGLKSY